MYLKQSCIKYNPPQWSTLQRSTIFQLVQHFGGTESCTVGRKITWSCQRFASRPSLGRGCRRWTTCSRRTRWNRRRPGRSDLKNAAGPFRVFHLYLGDKHLKTQLYFSNRCYTTWAKRTHSWSLTRPTSMPASTIVSQLSLFPTANQRLKCWYAQNLRGA